MHIISLMLTVAGVHIISIILTVAGMHIISLIFTVAGTKYNADTMKSQIVTAIATHEKEKRKGTIYYDKLLFTGIEISKAFIACHIITDQTYF